MLNVSGDGQQQYVVDAFIGGSAFFDYDRDGDLDLYVLNGSRVGGFPGRDRPRNALYRNEGATFLNATEESGLGDTGWGMGCAVADYDNDGDADLYVTNYGSNALYENRGEGAFADVAQRAGVFGRGGIQHRMCFLRLRPRWRSRPVRGKLRRFRSFHGNHSRQETRVAGVDRPFRPARDAGERRTYSTATRGAGVFADATAAAGLVDRDMLYGLGVVAGDYDNDGDSDIYVANDTGPNYLYENRGDGTFTDVAWMKGAAYGEGGQSQGCMGIAFGDYDNDAYPDILVTNFWEETNTLYHNDGGRVFLRSHVRCGEWGWKASSSSPGAPSFFDYRQRRRQGSFRRQRPRSIRRSIGRTWESAMPQTNQLFKNRGDGTFAEVSLTSGAGLQIEKVSRGASFGDYDEDGDLDIFVLELNDLPTLLRNDGGDRNKLSDSPDGRHQKQQGRHRRAGKNSAAGT